FVILYVMFFYLFFFFFFSSRRRHTRSYGDWSSDVCSSDLSFAANWVMTEVLADAKDHGDGLRVQPGALANLIGLVRGGTLSHQAAKRVFSEVAEHGGEPRNVAEALGLIQVADAGVVTGWVSEVL